MTGADLEQRRQSTPPEGLSQLLGISNTQTCPQVHTAHTPAKIPVHLCTLTHSHKHTSKATANCEGDSDQWPLDDFSKESICSSPLAQHTLPDTPPLERNPTIAEGFWNPQCTSHILRKGSPVVAKF